MPYEVLSHTADTGIEATAPSISALIEVLATGMFDLMATVAPGPHDVAIEVEVVAPTLEDLVVELLSELLYESEVQDLVLCEFETTMLGPTHARINARGVDISGVEVTGPPIKAVTYHAVVVDRREEDWLGRVYFDV
ncbi:MAG: archease [Acidimicrobiia bacterium]